MNYKLTKKTYTLPAREYAAGYVDKESSRAACETCPTYGRNWSCPPYDEDISDTIWQDYDSFRIVLSVIELDASSCDGNTPAPAEAGATDIISDSEYIKQISDILSEVKRDMLTELMEEEKSSPGSLVLSAGQCSSCGEACARIEGKPCRQPESMRHSIESMGGDLVKTAEELFGIELDWAKDGHRPSRYIQALGILK